MDYGGNKYWRQKLSSVLSVTHDFLNFTKIINHFAFSGNTQGCLFKANLDDYQSYLQHMSLGL